MPPNGPPNLLSKPSSNTDSGSISFNSAPPQLHFFTSPSHHPCFSFTLAICFLPFGLQYRLRTHWRPYHLSFGSCTLFYVSPLRLSFTSLLHLIVCLEDRRPSVVTFSMRIAPLSTIACLLTAVAAQSGSTSNPPTIPQGLTFTAGKLATFTWTPTTSGTVTLTLRNGPSNNLNKGTVVACAYRCYSR